MAGYIEDDSEDDSDLQDPVRPESRRTESPLSDEEPAHNTDDEMDFMKVTSEKDQVSVHEINTLGLGR